MKFNILVILIINAFFLMGALKPALAIEHTQKNGLFSMDIPEGWHWFEYPEEIIITYSDAKTVAMDIQLVPSKNLSQAEIKKNIKDGNDKMIKEGIEAHRGTLIDNKELKLDGVYATQLNFKTSLPDSVYVTYISLFNKGYAITITYGSQDEKMRLVMDDALATVKLR